MLTVSREVLDGCGGLEGLVRSDAEALRYHALGSAKIAVLAAAAEIARRVARKSVPDRRPLQSPDVVARYLGLRFAATGQEVMGALFLDTRQRLVGETEVFRGALSRATVEPRPILRKGILLSAAGLLLFHTHPSGDPTPSAEDLAFTRRMAAAGEVVGIRLVDHLVLGSGGRWRSLRSRVAW